MRRENYADILCIGAQRAMTSWLHQVISHHPQTWAFPDFDPVTSTRKEAHFWDWNHHRGRDWYRVLMTPPDDPGLKSLDFTPDYALLNDDQIAECKALNPGACVIYILREPLARAVSAIRMHTMWASNGAPADALRIGFGREFLDRVQAARIQRHGDYAGNLRRWRRHYPDLLVLEFAQLAADPPAGLARVLDACNLPAAPLVVQPDHAARLHRTVWHAPDYALDADCLHFLDGMLWREREEIAAETGLRFERPDPAQFVAPAEPTDA
ncbi:MAG: Sulfotransferase domain [Rhodobacteraceae bacterium HLUCCA12]|nr:MAG: Sulfotransferase domain [Rhodobacteraceae bacterium HLUCCA12]